MSLQSIIWNYFIGLPLIELILIASLIVILIAVGYLGYRMYVIENKFGAIPSSSDETKVVHTTITPSPPSIESPNVAVGLAVSNAVRSIMNETGLDQHQAVQVFSYMLNKMDRDMEKAVSHDDSPKVEQPAARPKVLDDPAVPIEQEVAVISSEIGKLKRDEESLHKKRQEALRKLDDLKSKIPADVQDAVILTKKEQTITPGLSDREAALQKLGNAVVEPVVVETKEEQEPEPNTGFLHAKAKRKKSKLGEKDEEFSREEESKDIDVAEPRVPGKTEKLAKEQPEVQVEKEEAEQQEKEKDVVPRKRKEAAITVEGAEVLVRDLPSLK